MNGSSITVYPNSEALFHAAARRVGACARLAVEARGAFFVALAGGSTPRGLYQELADLEPGEAVDWYRTHVFFGDERFVSWSHPDSNYRMARETLLDRVPIPQEQIHPVPVDTDDARQAARRYAECLHSALPRDADGVPLFDLILLGLGADGHTASLFPGTSVLEPCKQPVTAVHSPGGSGWRVTLTLPVLSRARALMFVVTGSHKADAVARTLAADAPDPRLPVSCIQPRGHTEWLVDADAARQLPGARP